MRGKRQHENRPSGVTANEKEKPTTEKTEKTGQAYKIPEQNGNT